MAVDKTKLAFNSNNEIDRLVATGTVGVGAGVSQITTFASASLPPIFSLQFQPSGSPLWYATGHSDHGGTNIYLHSYIENAAIMANCSHAGTVRYFVWSDKVNY